MNEAAPAEPVEDAPAAAPADPSPQVAGTESGSSGFGSDTITLGEAPAVAQEAAPATAGLVAEPQEPSGKFTTATEVKPILGATKSSWVAVREYDGQDLLYVTQILSWRCGLLEMKVGLNGAPPERWDLPECHLDLPMPGALLDGDGAPYRGYELGSIQQIEVELIYDDLSTDRAVFSRDAVKMQ